MKNLTPTQLQKATHQKLTNHAKKAILEAERLAKQLSHSNINALHLIYAIYLEYGSLGSNLMKDAGISEKSFARLLSAAIPTASSRETIGRIITRAYAIAKEFRYSYVGTEHLIYAIIQSSPSEIMPVISKNSLQKLTAAVRSFFDPSQFSNLPKIFELPEIIIGKKSAKKSSTTPFIDRFCININREAEEKHELIVGREKEISRIINILGRKNKNNPLLIGNPGVGKTALVSGLAQLINSPNVPPALYKKKIMGLDVAQLIAGTGFRGEFENRLKEIIKEAVRHRNIILFIDEIHTIVGAGNIPGGMDLANIIKPALARGEVQIIGATTFSEYKKYIEKDLALERRFQPVLVGEPTPAETKKILLGIRKNYETFHNVLISDEIIESAVSLGSRYIHHRFMPDKIIDVLDETASHLRANHTISSFLEKIQLLERKKELLILEKEQLVLEENYTQAAILREKEQSLEKELQALQAQHADEQKKNPLILTLDDILKTISQISKVPLEKIAQEKNIKTRNIQKTLGQKIIGQSEVIEKIAHVLLRSQAGISNPDRPIGSFLFLGPTGVGKTLSAHLLAQDFFGLSDSLVRIDMSELMEKHSISSLIGSPAGYIGYGEGGRLTEKVRRNPYCVVLFDEIEKAHPDVFNVLLQILEDGILTDAEGVRVDFKNTIIILTSNIGTTDFTQTSRIGFDTHASQEALHKKFDAIKQRTLSELQKKIRPELLNRLDNILVFNPLGEKEIKKIVQTETAKLIQRLGQQKIKLAITSQALDFVAKKSLDFNQGARLVRKNIQELFENPVAEMIVYGKVRDGKIKITLANEKLELV